MQSVQDLIISKISLGRESSLGFRSVICQCCNDYKERGAFKITPTEVIYNCFNCSTKATYNSSDNKISKKFKKILQDFGISKDEIDKVDGSLRLEGLRLLKNETPAISLDSIKQISFYTPEVNLPENSVRVGSVNCDNLITQRISNYLTEERALTINSYPFYYCNDIKYKNRIIIPYFKYDKIIYWQARTMVKSEIPRYRNCEVPKSAIIFNVDELTKFSNDPLFVCEGVFDAIHLNGIALLGGTISEVQLELLKKSKRPLIFVIDKDQVGKSLGFKVLKEKLGSITIPDGVGDVTDKIKREGKSWTIYSLIRGQIYDERLATIKLNSIRDNNVRFRKTT